MVFAVRGSSILMVVALCPHYPFCGFVFACPQQPEDLMVEVMTLARRQGGDMTRELMSRIIALPLRLPSFELFGM